jgi:membrane dipeptidase
MLYVEEAEDILKAKEKDKLGVILQFQNSLPVETDLRLLEVWYKLGVRIIQLAYNPRNLVADGCYEKTDCGLSDYGRNMVEEMNRIGMLIDLSHVGTKSANEAIELSKETVIFSHANAKALADVPRNLTDDQIKAVAEKDGVIGIGAPSFILKKGGEETGTDINDYVKHIDYMVNLVGPEYVGIGTDYEEGRPKPRACFDSLTDLVKVVAILLDRGYSDQEVSNIMGGNWFRVFKKVWKTH